MMAITQSRVTKPRTGPTLPTKRPKEELSLGVKRSKFAKDDEADVVEVPDGLTAEIRYDHAEDAARALLELNRSVIQAPGSDSARITVMQDDRCSDGTKLAVSGLPRNLRWQELKDHFKQCGQVAFVDIKSSQTCRGEVRFDDPQMAQEAVTMFNGSEFMGSSLTVQLDTLSHDASKLVVFGIPRQAKWQDLKEHFATLAPVAYADIKDSGDANKGKGGFCMMSMMGGKGGKGFGIPQEWAAGYAAGLAAVGMWPSSGCGGGGGFGGADGGKGKRGRAGANGGVGELRFEEPQSAQRALREMEQSVLGGATVRLETDPRSKDGTKFVVHDIPAGVEWQELKEHFAAVGTVAFADIISNPEGAADGSQGGVGELRFDEPEGAERAMREMNGSLLAGSPLRLQTDQRSKDGSKLIVYGIPANVGWQELKDHFASAGRVAFADVATGPKGVQQMPPIGQMWAPTAMPGKGWGQPAGGFGAPTVPMGKGMKGGRPAFGPPPTQIASSQRAGGGAATGSVGEVRFEGADAAAAVDKAIETYDGGDCDGRTIKVVRDAKSPDGTKLLVLNLPPGYHWQELKDTFKHLGSVAFVQTK